MQFFEPRQVVSPKIQAALVVGASLVFMLISKMVFDDPLKIWLVSAAMILLHSIMANIQSILVADFVAYTKESIFSFRFTFIILGGLSTFFSGLSIFDANSYRTIYIVLLVTFFLFFGIIVVIKSFLSFLKQKDDKMM